MRPQSGPMGPNKYQVKILLLWPIASTPGPGKFLKESQNPENRAYQNPAGFKNVLFDWRPLYRYIKPPCMISADFVKIGTAYCAMHHADPLTPS